MNNLDAAPNQKTFPEKIFQSIAHKFLSLAEWQFGKLPIKPSSLDALISKQPSRILEQITIVRTQTGMQIPPNIRRWIAHENLSNANRNLAEKIIPGTSNQDSLEENIATIIKFVNKNIAIKSNMPSDIITPEIVEKWIRTISATYLLKNRDRDDHQIPPQIFHNKAIAILAGNNPEKWKSWANANNINSNSFYNLGKMNNILQNYLDNY